MKSIIAKLFTLAGNSEKNSANQSPISARLNSILWLSSAILITSFVLFSGYTIANKHKDTVQRMRSLAAILAINSEAPLDFSDKQSAEENLYALTAIAEISGAGIVKPNGDTLAIYSAPSDPAANRSGTVHNLVNKIFTGKLHLEQPVFAPHLQSQQSRQSNRPIIGQVWLEADLTDDWIELTFVLSVFILVLFGIYCLVRVLNNRLVYSVITPLEELAQTALEIGQNRNYDKRLMLQPDITELTTVVQGFNQMLEQIHSRDQELQNRQDLLEQYNQELKDFSYIVSHDLRAPMINVQGFVHELGLSLNELRTLLSKEIAHMPEQQRSAIQTIFDKDIPTSTKFITGGIAKMNQLLAGILKISRLGRQELNISLVDIQHVVNDNIEAIKYQSNQASAEFEVKPLPQVESDPYLLGQIFANLLSNAVKYLDPSRPGKIEVWAEPHDDHIKFFVKDNGLGIAKKDQRKVFEMFRRGSNHSVEGEGIGLNYVKSAIKRLGGTITLDSIEGQGSVFCFTLPTAA